jgi:hypothetical protein
MTVASHQHQIRIAGSAYQGDIFANKGFLSVEAISRRPGWGTISNSGLMAATDGQKLLISDSQGLTNTANGNIVALARSEF